jgi:ubiquinone/menaquinone biosynthesis C-methylase UbiE
MEWKPEELGQLEAILQRIEGELVPLPGKEIVVLCCREGQVALWLGRKMAGRGRVVGLDLSDESLAQARRQARAEGLEGVVWFEKADMHRLPLADGTLDAVVSEFVVYPTLLVTQIGQGEMARVLRPGGRVLLTDVITPRPFPAEIKEALRTVGLGYLCEATADDFREWMSAAGLRQVEVEDLTPLVRPVWEQRRAQDPAPEHRPAYAILLDDPRYRLGQGLLYIYVRGEK